MEHMNYRHHYRHWIIKAPLGLSIIGFGLCLVLDAAFLKYAGASTLHWVAYGTLALVVFNSGVSIFGDAVKHRVHWENAQNGE
jgi:hypothetical protein